MKIQPGNVHLLSLNDISFQDQSNVMFRFAFSGTSASAEYEGFGMDEFFVGERSRLVLIETFTNENDQSGSRSLK